MKKSYKYSDLNYGQPFVILNDPAWAYIKTNIDLQYIRLDSKGHFEDLKMFPDEDEADRHECVLVNLQIVLDGEF